MKTLILLRHGRAEDKEAKTDLERRLDDTGRMEARDMGQWLLQNGIMPDLIISSHAQRAHETATLAAEPIAYNGKNIKIEEEVYRTDAYDLLDLVQAQDDKFKTVMVVGHNPTISELAARLGGESDSLPTAGLRIYEGESPTWHNWAAMPVKLVQKAEPGR